MADLVAVVHVSDEKGVSHIFNPGDDVPEWAKKLITNPKAWGSVPVKESAPQVDAANPTPPPAPAAPETTPAPAEPPAPSAPVDKAGKAFSQLNHEELVKLATAEGVSLEGLGTNKEIREAITVRRAAK